MIANSRKHSLNISFKLISTFGFKYQMWMTVLIQYFIIIQFVNIGQLLNWKNTRNPEIIFDFYDQNWPIPESFKVIGQFFSFSPEPV